MVLSRNSSTVTLPSLYIKVVKMKLPDSIPEHHDTTTDETKENLPAANHLHTKIFPATFFSSHFTVQPQKILFEKLQFRIRANPNPINTYTICTYLSSPNYISPPQYPISPMRSSFSPIVWWKGLIWPFWYWRLPTCGLDQPTSASDSEASPTWMLRGYWQKHCKPETFTIWVEMHTPHVDFSHFN